MNCRSCNEILYHMFIDLVSAPPSNSFLTREGLDEPEVYYPLKLFVCENCFLVQIDEYKKSHEIFDGNYAYFSSYSKSWLGHAKKYVDMVIERFCLNDKSQVIEIASNDGYLLQYFKPRNIPVLGVEPADNVAQTAMQKGIETITEFFGEKLARQLAARGQKADLLIGNNVFAHVPRVNDFIAGMKIILKESGIITMEFPHLMRLIEQNQFDTIYHEHYSYFSFHTTLFILEKHGLEVFDVDEIPTHGGSLRIYAKHKEDTTKAISPNVTVLLQREEKKGMRKLEYYLGFQQKADRIKFDLLGFLLKQRQDGRKVSAYGAAAKGNTLLNYCGIKGDLVEFVVDASPQKQGKFLPGSHIPVVSENKIRELKPDFVLILPWNIRDEIMVQLDYIRDWGGRFVVPIPSLQVL